MVDSKAAVPVTDREWPNAWLVAAIAWIVPGGGHALVGRRRKAVIFFAALILMTTVGLAFGGRLFPFQMAEPLVFLAAVAQWAQLAPRILADLAGWGQGRVVAITYEYGNTFLIVAGLLNILVVFDAFDRARGRRRS
jgi:hypothetical protein